MPFADVPCPLRLCPGGGRFFTTPSLALRQLELACLLPSWGIVPGPRWHCERCQCCLRALGSCQQCRETCLPCACAHGYTGPDAPADDSAKQRGIKEEGPSAGDMLGRAFGGAGLVGPGILWRRIGPAIVTSAADSAHRALQTAAAQQQPKSRGAGGGVPTRLRPRQRPRGPRLRKEAGGRHSRGSRRGGLQGRGARRICKQTRWRKQCRSWGLCICIGRT